MSVQPLLQAVNLTKLYGSLRAIDHVNLVVYPGEVIGVVGRNGAGVTTLFQLLARRLTPDLGRVEYGRGPARSRHGAREMKLSLIYQQPALAEQLDVTTNIFLGNELGFTFLEKWLVIPHQRRMVEAAIEILARMDAPFISPSETVANLSPEQRQLVAIARVMAQDNDVILVDNPNLLLSIPYQRKLLRFISKWQNEGRSVLFNSNNLEHLFAVCDRLIVLRQGRLVANRRTDETTGEEIVAALVGSDDRNQRTPAIWALDSYYQAREQAEMLRHNQQLLERHLQARDRLNSQLVDQLAEQVQALDRANLALQAAQRRLLTEREQERKRLAREIHDQAIQDLLTLNYRIEEIEQHIGKPAGDPALELEEIRDAVRELVEDLRRICGDLRPPTIDSLGLGAAVRSFAADWRRRTGIDVKLELADEFGRLPEAIELSIFRIIQEGLNNIWKHSAATAATVSLKPSSPRMLLLSISDNGHGLDRRFELSTLGSENHFGLLGISERVALMGGRLQVENKRQGGLLIRAEIPHPKIVPQL